MRRLLAGGRTLQVFGVIVCVLLIFGSPLILAPSAPGSRTAHAATVWNVTILMDEEMYTWFDPEFISINVGDTVNWTCSANPTDNPCTFSSQAGQAETWSSGVFSVGSSFDFTFTIPGSYFYAEDGGSTEIGAVFVEGVASQPGNETTPAQPGNETTPASAVPSALSAFVALPEGVMYLLFQVLFLFGSGGAVVTLATAAAADVTKERKYSDCGRLFAKAAAVFEALSSLLLVLLMAANYFSIPTVFSLLFMPSVFAVPLVLTLTLSLAATFFLWRSTVGKSGPQIASDLHMKLAAAGFSVASIISFNLVNSFTLTPPLPQGAVAVIAPRSLSPLDQMWLMANQGWFPLSVKLLFAGAMSFAVLLSGLAVLAKVGHGGLGARSPFDFVISWGFKAGIIFGAPLGILGYWNAAIMHAVTPVLAMGLMGKSAPGFSSALISIVGPLWDIGIIGAMSLGGLAVTYYASKGMRLAPVGGEAGLVLRKFLPWFLTLLALGVISTLYVGAFYPGQFILSIYVLVGGFLMWEALRRYTLGRTRLLVPVALFAFACYGLIAYMAPYTDWYMAGSFGGVCWPLIGFPLLVLVGSYAAIKANRAWYSIPLIAALLAPLVIIIKSAEVEIAKGAGIVAVDPTVKGILSLWAYANSYSLSAIDQQYYVPTGVQLVLIMVVAYAILSLVMLTTHRMVASYRVAHIEGGPD